MKVTLDEIMAARSARGGWSAATLATWGVPWPPPKGWKEALVAGGGILRDHLQDQKNTAPASNDHTEVRATIKIEKPILMPQELGKRSASAYLDAYVLVHLFVKRLAFTVTKIEIAKFHTNTFVTDGANEIAISVFNTGAISVIENKGVSPLRTTLLEFVKTVSPSRKNTSAKPIIDLASQGMGDSDEAVLA